MASLTIEDAIESPDASATADTALVDRLAADDILRRSFESLPPLPHPLRQPLRAIVWLISAFFGLVCLLVLMTIAAAIPGLNVYAMGYLLEAQGRVARTGKPWHSLPLLPAARRIGVILLAAWLWLLPVQYLGSAASDSWLVNPGGATAWLWLTLLIVAVVIVSTHLILALARGGGWWCFFRPVKNVRWLLASWKAGDYFERADTAVRQFITALRVPHHLKLGIIGFVATYAWLLLPTLMYTSLRDATMWWQRALMLIGGVTLTLVFMWLPFLQAHYAARGHWSAMFDLQAVRKRFRHAPFSHLLAVVILFGPAMLLPLYQALFKAELPPLNIWLDIMLLTLVLTFPGRILAGWAYHRGGRERKTWLIWHWTNRLLLAGGVGLYVAFLMFAASSGELGQRVIWQHHALLLPLPF